MCKKLLHIDLLWNLTWNCKKTLYFLHEQVTNQQQSKFEGSRSKIGKEDHLKFKFQFLQREVTILIVSHKGGNYKKFFLNLKVNNISEDILSNGNMLARYK